MNSDTVGVPTGATADEWSDEGLNRCRVVWGSTHSVTVARPSNEGLCEVGVYTHAVQRADGTLSHDPADGGPGVSIDTKYAGEGWARESGVTVSAAEARQLATALLAAADEIGGWEV